MTYRESLKCWAIVRTAPKTPAVVVSRFRSRSDAEGHRLLMQEQFPGATLIVMFDRQPQDEEPDAETHPS